jgi:hypothetical protein
MTELPRHQHFVPQLLLRRFAFGKKPQVHVLHKRDGRSFVAPVNRAASQRGYYNVPAHTTREVLEMARKDGFNVPVGEDVVLSLEPLLGTIESKAASLIERIVRKESLAGLTDDDREIVAYFATVQYLRVPHQRGMYGQMVDAVRERLGAMLEGMGRTLKWSWSALAFRR